MTDSDRQHQEQIEYWNGAAGSRWADQQNRTDRMLAPVADILLSRAGVAPGDAVLDLGCGCGSTTETIAELVGPAGKVLGLDVSAPMISVAERRLAGTPYVSFVRADAARHPFPEPVADILVSRFGVMFFGDPTAAFSNFGKALKSGGRMIFACWRKPDENPWMIVPLQAAYAHVPRLPKLGPEDPGPYSFADPERITRIVSGAGFGGLRITPRDVALDISAGEGLDGAMIQAAEIGPTSRALEGQPEAARSAALAAVRQALHPYATPTGVLLKGAIWIVEAVRV